MAVIISMYEKHQRRVQVSAERLVYQRAWKVIVTDDATGRGASVADYLDIMAVVNATVQLGSQYPGKSAYLCNDIDVAENEDGEISEVTASYEIQDTSDVPEDFDQFMNAANGVNADNANNPWRPRRSGNGMVVEEYRWKDYDGQPFVNKAKQPLVNIPPLYVTIQVKRVTVLERDKPDTSRQGACDGQILLANISYEENEHKNKSTGVLTAYYANTYEVWIHPDRPWHTVEIINAGFAYIKNGKLVLNKDPDNGEVITEPRNLKDDGSGFLDAGRPPNYCEFKVRREVDLNIPFGP